MKFITACALGGLLAFGAGIVAVPAEADVVLPNGVTATSYSLAIAWSGLGPDGVAVAGGLPCKLYCTQGLKRPELAGHILLITGGDPAQGDDSGVGGQGTVTVSTAGVGVGHVKCVGDNAWSMPDYAEGYPIPEWPDSTFISIAAYDVVKQTVTVRWKTLGNLKPQSNYSLNIMCDAAN